MEREYPHSQTGGLKLMTVFIVVLALHVVVIGGISAYHIMRGDDKEARDLAIASNRDVTGQGDGTGNSGASDTTISSSGDNSGSGSVAFAPPSTQPVEPTGSAPAPAPLPPIAADTPASAPAYDPSAPPRATALPPDQQDVPPGMGNYTVRKGDSLRKIASRFNLSVDDLIAINNLTSDNIRPGQTLKLTGSRVAGGGHTDETASTTGSKDKNKPRTPGDKSTDKTADKTDKSKKPGTTTAKAEPQKHKVETGDTLAYLAKRYKTTIAAIRSANGLEDTVTKPKAGTTLKIPTTASTKDVARNNN